MGSRSHLSKVEPLLPALTLARVGTFSPAMQVWVAPASLGLSLGRSGWVGALYGGFS